ncbi:MAG TPA: hypothetical protein PK384_08470, partial [Candidatus Latescibacteria bacterium]|nr:hypothetical protein [Candidatus Latescibacterota bacterium]
MDPADSFLSVPSPGMELESGSRSVTAEPSVMKTVSWIPAFAGMTASVEGTHDPTKNAQRSQRVPHP